MSDESVKTIRGTFPTREAADLAIEHLTQEHDIDRADVFVQAAGSSNSSGTRPSGGDAPSTRGEHPREDSQLEGGIEVSADVSELKFAAARQVFENAGARDLSTT